MQKLAQRIDNHYLDNGFLYRHASDGDILCVPQDKPKKGPDSRTRILMELHDNKMSGHRGVHATYLAVRRRYYWPKLHKDVARFIGSCEQCQTSKKTRLAHGGNLQPLEIPLTHGTHYGMDFITDLPRATQHEYDTCYVVVDMFSKKVYLIPTWKNAKAQLIAEQFYERVVREKGAPLSFVGDRDSKWTSNFWQSLWSLMGCSVRLSSARQQNTDGQAERVINVLEEILRTGINYRQDNWVELLTSTEFAVNNSVAAGHGLTPFYVEGGRHPLVPLDLGSLSPGTPATRTTTAKNTMPKLTSEAGGATPSGGATTQGKRYSLRGRAVRAAQAAAGTCQDTRAASELLQWQPMCAPARAHTDAPSRARLFVERVVAAHRQASDKLAETRLRMCEQVDARRRPVDIRVDTRVWLSAEGITLDIHRDRTCKKLTPVFYGPFRVLEQISPVSFRLDLPANIKIHDVFHVHRLKSTLEAEFKGRRPKKVPALKDDHYEVEAIVNHRVMRGKEEFLVQWKGYSLHHNTWEPLEHLTNAKKALQDYRERQ